MLPRSQWRVWSAAAVAAAVLAGCVAGGGQYERWLNTRIGVSVDQLVEDMGPAHEIAKDGKGNSVYHWSFREVQSHAATARDSFQYKHPDQKKRAQYCETRFVVGRDRKVKSWSYRGSDCEPPTP